MPKGCLSMINMFSKESEEEKTPNKKKSMKEEKEEGSVKSEKKSMETDDNPEDRRTEG